MLFKARKESAPSLGSPLDLPKSPRSVRVTAGLAAVFATAVCSWIWTHSFALARSDVRSYSTRVGERTTIPFADGATVYLNTASRIVLHSTAKLHAARLLSGEALFDVPLAATPVSLTAGELQIDAPGAQFDVRREPTRLLVSVLDGQVRLACRCTADAIVLAVGEQLEISRQDGLAQLQRRSLLASEREHLVMWRDGHLFFEGAPLAAAAKELNRYNHRQLVVGDAATADLRIGGRFSANDVDSFVAAIQKTFGVQAQREDDGWVIRER